MSVVTFTTAELTALAALIAPMIQGAPTPTPVPTPTPTPTPTPIPTPGVEWIFNGGVRDSAGDYSYGTGKVTYGATVVVTGDEGWQPRMPNDDLDMKPYKYALVSIKPTQKHSWTTGMLQVGDVAIPGSHGAIDIAPYALKPVVLNAWNDFKIPLSVFGTMPFHAYKIMFLAQNVPSPATNHQEFDRLGFSAT